MYRTESRKYHEIKIMGKDVYGFKSAYSIRPIKLTPLVSKIICVGKEDLSNKDIGTSIGVGIVNGLAGLAALGLISKHKLTTYQLVIDGESHLILTNEKSAIRGLDALCRRYR